jgi:hypothetical protein
MPSPFYAYLLDGCRDSLSRAEVLGQGLIYAQANNFPFNDGRFAQGYFVNQPSASAITVSKGNFKTSARGQRPAVQNVASSL